MRANREINRHPNGVMQGRAVCAVRRGGNPAKMQSRSPAVMRRPNKNLPAAGGARPASHLFGCGSLRGFLYHMTTKFSPADWLWAAFAAILWIDGLAAISLAVWILAR